MELGAVLRLVLLVAALVSMNGVDDALAQPVSPPDPAPSFPPHQGGAWGPVIEWPHVSVSMANLPDGRVLTFASNEPNDWPASSSDEYTHAAVWDPATGEIRSVPHPSHDMFCAAVVTLEDGRTFVMGGRNAGLSPYVSYYDFYLDRWVQFDTAEDMNDGRWYPTAVYTGSGEIFIAGGSGAGIHPERWEPDAGWTLLTGINLVSSILSLGFIDGSGTWPLLQLAPDGTIFHHGATEDMHRFDPVGPGGLGSVTPLGPHGYGWYPDEGVSVLYDEGKILVAGGSTRAGFIESRPEAYRIDVNGPGPVLTPASPMHYPRQFMNEVVLPTGDVLVVGGNTNGVKFDDNFAIRNAESWSPSTDSWTLLNAQDQARTYHSSAILLPDARVMSGGGGLNGDPCPGTGAPGECGVDHWNVEIFSPPYLFAADDTPASRPEIQAAPAVSRVGQGITVYATPGLGGFSLVRMSATTHTMNTDQRFLRPNAVETSPGVYSLTLHSNEHVLVPGYWMLFALDGDVPSVAHPIQIVNDGTPRGPPIESMQNEVGDDVLFSIELADPDGAPITFSATGLPTGLAIEATTGVISGTTTNAGLFNVQIEGDDGAEEVEIDFPWIVSLEQSEIGTRTSVPGSWESVSLAHYYDEPVVILGPATWSDPRPTTVRVREVSASTFEFRVQSWPSVGGPPHGPETVDFLAVESGEYVLPGGGVLLAGVAAGIDQFNPWTQPFPAGAFTGNPTVLVQVASQSQGASSPPTTVRVDGVSADGFTMRLQVEEAANPNVPAEDVHWIAFESANVPALFETNAAPRLVDDGGTSVSFSQGFSDAPRLFAQIQTIDEEDSVTLRAHARSSAGFDVFAEEESSADGELAHTAEQVGWLAIEPTATTLGLLPLYNQAPSVIALGDQQTVRGDAVSLSVSAIDPEGNTLSFAATGLPPGLAIDVQTGEIEGTPTLAGVYHVEVVVSDPNPAESSISLVWTVEERLELIAFATPPATEGTVFEYAALTSIPGPFEFTWDFGDGSSAVGPQSDPTISHVFSGAGRFTVTLTVDDTASGQQDVLQFVQIVATTPSATAASSSSTLAFEGGQQRVWAVNPDNDSVAVIDATTHMRIAEIPVAAGPRTLALAADGTVWVACKEAATIDRIDPTTLLVTSTLPLPSGSDPHGIVFDHTGTIGFVALEGTGEVLRLDAVTPAILASASVGPDVRELAVAADGATLFVPRFITPPLPGEASGTPTTSGGGEVLVLDATTLTMASPIVLGVGLGPDTATHARGVPNYLGAPAISPDGTALQVPSKQDNVFRGGFRDLLNLEHDRTVRAITSRVDLGTALEDQAARVDHDDASVAKAARFSSLGGYLFVALEGNREIAVIDPWSALELGRFDTGRAPHGLALSPDGSTLYVDEFMDRSVSIYDLSPLLDYGDTMLVATATVPKVGAEVLPPDVLLGKQHFYDAADPRLAFQSYLNCAACHSESGGDGRTWDFTDLGEGLRNTIDLRGHGSGMGRLHWTANFDEFQDFEGQVRHFNAQGLMSFIDFQATSDPLGPPKAGLSADLDALAAYLASLTSTGASPHRAPGGALTPDGEAGASLFADTGCGGCHAGTAFTDSESGATHDVGTITGASGAVTALDTPTLRGLWRTAPYLHDGSAATLEEAIAAHAGVTLDAAERASVASYLRQIDDAEFEAPNGAPNVEITAPLDGTIFPPGSDVTLEATATDPEDGDLSSSISWTSSVHGPLGSGTPRTLSGLFAGTHTITASVTDSNGQTRNDAIQLTIEENTNPELTVTSPLSSVTFLAGQLVVFTGTAFDAEDGDLTDEILWVSNLDGELGTGANVQVSTMSVGTHVVIARVMDSLGGTESFPAVVTILANGPPMVAISNPASGTSIVEGTLVPLTGTASDPEDGDLTATIVWTSDVDGPLGLGGSVSAASLSIGTHLLTASVSDAQNNPGSAQISITITANQPPTVAITAPTSGASFTEGDPIDLIVVATDPEDGDLAPSASWQSDLDGPLGGGAHLIVDTLTVGTHTISVEVTDSHAENRADATVVTVPEPGFAIVVGVGSLVLARLRRKADVRLRRRADVRG